jgi:hypothetical protein
MLRQDNTAIMLMNMLPVARKLSAYWDGAQLAELSRICLLALNRELMGWEAQGLEVTANVEAIQAIGACGVVKDCEALSKLCGVIKYRSPLLYAFGRCGVNQKWVYQQFLSDVRLDRAIQDSLRAVGLSVYKWRGETPEIDIEKVAVDVAVLINRGYLHKDELSIAIVTLAMLISGDRAGQGCEEDYAVGDIAELYGDEAFVYTQKARLFAAKLMRREELTGDDEAFLLGMLMDIA